MCEGLKLGGAEEEEPLTPPARGAILASIASRTWTNPKGAVCYQGSKISLGLLIKRHLHYLLFSSTMEYSLVQSKGRLTVSRAYTLLTVPVNVRDRMVLSAFEPIQTMPPSLSVDSWKCREDSGSCEI